MSTTGIFVPIIIVALVLAVVIVIAAVLLSRRKQSFPKSGQPQQGQYQQYPGTPQTGGPQTGGPVPGAPQFNGPGFPQKPQRPGWVIPLVIVAVAAVVLCGVLGGILIGQRLGVNSGSVEKVTPEPVPTEAPAPSLPESSSAPEQASQPAGGTAQSQPAESSQAGPASKPSFSPKADFPQTGKLWTLNDCVDEVIDWIEDGSAYVKRYDFEPLGCVDDFDGDGSQDFLALFQTETGNGTREVSYVVFTFSESGPKLLDDGILYQEAGGNGGSVGIAKGKDGTVYLTRCVKQPAGDTVNNQYAYIPWDSVGIADETGSYYMEARWTVGEEEKGTYILGDTKVDRDTFEQSRGNYTVLYELNIVAGHGNGLVNGVDFDTLEKWYDD